MNVVLQMRCGAIFTANLFKARSFANLEVMSWVSKPITQDQNLLSYLEKVELAMPIGVAIYSVWWFLGMIDWCMKKVHVCFRDQAEWQSEAKKGITAHPVHRSVLV